MRAARAPGELASALAVAIRISWRNHRGAFCGLLAAAALAGLVPAAAAWLLRAILDELASRHRLAELLAQAAALGAAGALGAILPSVNAYLSAQSARAVQMHATSRLFTAVNRLTGLRTLEDPAFHDNLRFAQQAGASGPGQVLSAVITITQSAITLAGFLVTLAVLSPVLAAVLAASVIPACYLERRAARRQAAVLRGITHAQRRQLFYAGLLTSVTVAKEIRLFGLGAFFRDRMLTELGEVQRSSAQGDRRVLATDATLGGLSAAIAAAGVLWAVVAAARGQLTVGDVALLVAAFTAANGALGSIIASATMAYQALLTFSSYRQVLATPPDLRVPARPVRPSGLRRGIEIADVWFRYGADQPWILRGVSCFIPRGQAVALVGENGAGKSTLVKLLCRFYDPERGRILWDDTDLRDMDPAALRERISATFQDYVTYELSAADNIAVGDLSQGAEPDRLHAAARQVGIHDTLAGLPRGYQTLLTRSFFDTGDASTDDPQAGVVLSGGQWQRVALARAFLRGGRDLMIMDEPSAGLDAQAEYDIHQQLTLSRRDRTTLLISHRLSTIRDADHIVVLSGGVNSEQGSHDDLMRLGGTYARLFSLQARGYAPGLVSTGASHD